MQTQHYQGHESNNFRDWHGFQNDATEECKVPGCNNHSLPNGCFCQQHYNVFKRWNADNWRKVGSFEAASIFTQRTY